jgi:glycosyltransferase involved in cell wall biosynthesis
VSVVCPKGPGDPGFEELEGVRLHKYRPPRPVRGPIGYAYEFAWCWLWTALLARRIHRADPIAAMQACNPPDTYWVLARAFRRHGTRFVFDHHDLCPELYRSRGGAPARGIVRFLEYLERRTYRTADAVITTNESYRRIGCARSGRAPDDVAVVRSGPDPATMVRGVADPTLKDGHDHLVCYLGIMGPQDGVDLVVRAAASVVHRLGRHDIRFAILGYGDCLESLRQLAVELDVANHVHFTGRVGPPEIAAWLSTAEVGLSPDTSTPFNDVSTMNKTLEYLAFELPVVAFDLEETVVSAGPAAAYVPSDLPAEQAVDEFAATVVGLVDDPARRAQMGRIGRARIEGDLGWPASAPRYVEVYDALLGARVPDVSAGRLELVHQ